MEDMALRKSPVRTLACLTANRANAQKSTGPATPAGKARVALNALKHGGRTDPAGCRKSFCGRATGRGRLCTAGSGRKLPPPLGGVNRRSSGGSIKLRRRHGAGRVAWRVCEQSRNVLSFHGHYARDSTFYQGFRLWSGGGGSASCSGCNGLATGRGGGKFGLCRERI